MLNDAIKDCYDAMLRYFDAPCGSVREHELWELKYAAERNVRMNARSAAEGRRIVKHIDNLASRVKWPQCSQIDELHFHIFLQGKYNMHD